jgi:DNA end-binding protein Ku
LEKAKAREHELMASQRSIASAQISFGLVAIPVRLFPSMRASERITFHFVRASDGSRLRQQYVAVKDGKLVERADMAKGYEFAKGEYVLFSPAEIKQLEEATTHSIDIQHFVPLNSVDPVYFQETFYLAPDKGGSKPYSLLTKALKQSGQCAIGRWVLRGKEHIVVIRPLEKGLAIHQLHFKAEMRTIDELGITLTSVSDTELRLANQLIDQLAAERFDPSAYTDEFRARVQAAIKRKVKGKEVAFAEPPQPSRPSNVIDLMGALRASLDASDRAGKPGQRKAPKRSTPEHSRTRRGRDVGRKSA